MPGRGVDGIRRGTWAVRHQFQRSECAASTDRGRWREIDAGSEDYLAYFQTCCRLVRFAVILEAMNALFI